MLLGLTQPLTGYKGYLLGGKGVRCVGMTALPPSFADCLEILGASTFWSPKGLSRPVMGLLYMLPLYVWPHCLPY